jgi:D-inositol-3-phosphate glycosyltransferase
MNLRIAMLSAHSCPVGQLGTKDTGGMSVYIRELARELGKRGHKIDVFTRVHDPRDPLIEALSKNVRLVHLKVGGEETMHKLVLYSYLPDFACALEAFRKDNDLRYDLIFSHYWLSAQVGQEVRLWWGVPNFAMFHTLGVIKNSLGVGEEEPELRIETEKELAQNCDRIIATTEREKRVLADLCIAPPDRVGVVPCGVNTRVFHPIERDAARAKVGLGEEKVVLFVGRIEPLKGIDLLMNAFASLPSRESTKLVIVGGDDESDDEINELSRLSDRLGMQNMVTFAGAVNHALMPYYYSAADVCVVPSHYESFGLVALESLACGTPVVATDVGDLSNIIRDGETGYVIADHSAESLSEKIAEVLSWPRRTQRRTRLIRSSVAGHSWGNVAKRIEDQFGIVLNGQLAAAK